MKAIELYDYQTQAVAKLRDNIRAGIKNQILCAPTGSGKTVIGAYMIQSAREKRSRCVFVVDRIALIDQTSATLDTYGIPHGVIQASHWRWRPDLPVQVASVQTLGRRDWPEGLDLIIVDEAHSMHGPIKERISARDCVTIGLTATPFSKGMGKWYDAVVSVTTTNRLIEDKRLAPFRVFAPSEPDMTGAKVSAGEWSDREAAERSMPIVGDLVREYLDKAAGRKFIAFGATIDHCREIQRQFMAAGVMARLYVSGTPDAEREEILAEYRKPDSYIRGLISVAALAKGFDVEDVSCIIMARPLRSSLAEHIQILGRGLRRDPANPDKECLVLDHAGNMVRFWDETADFFEESVHDLCDGKPKKKKKKKDTESKGAKCPKCAFVHRRAPTCPNCGYEYPPKKITHMDGELSEFGAPARITRGEKQQLFSMLLYIARSRGYKEGWAKHKYRERTGVWPQGLSPNPIPPTPEVRSWVMSQQIRWAKSKRRMG